MPPAAIAGCMQSADVDFLRREIAGALEQSGAGAERIAGIVRAMREIAHIGAEQDGRRPEPHDPEHHHDLQRAIGSPSPRSGPSFDASLPPVRCMPGEISLVVLNMLVQAVQAIVAAQRHGHQGERRNHRLDQAGQ